MNEILLRAKSLLKQGEVIAIPTETVYGLAANAFDESAIKKIFEIKQRPFFNPLIVHIKSIQYLSTVATNIPEKAIQLAHYFWPGSLTLVLEKKDCISEIVTAKKNTVAVRIPNHPVTLKLLQSLNFPLAAPSANPFGTISPTEAMHVIDYFQEKIPLVIDGGTCKNGIESTIVGFENGEPVLYRLGAITLEEIEKVIGKIKVKNKQDLSPNAPGMLEKHYAPKTNTYLVGNVNEYINQFEGKKIGVLLFNQKIENKQIIHSEFLSKTSNLKEAAANLYSAMHRIDKLNLDLIVCERLPNYNLGKSINDRLERATKK